MLVSAIIAGSCKTSGVTEPTLTNDLEVIAAAVQYLIENETPAPEDVVVLASPHEIPCILYPIKGEREDEAEVECTENWWLRDLQFQDFPPSGARRIPKELLQSLRDRNSRRDPIPAKKLGRWRVLLNPPQSETPNSDQYVVSFSYPGYSANRDEAVIVVKGGYSDWGSERFMLLQRESQRWIVAWNSHTNWVV